ncbi:MAG: hypothetical protein ACHQIO_16210 [Nevskiales bacterium]
MALLCRVVRWLNVRMASSPEVWCRPSTLLVLRDPGAARRCLAAWNI